MNKHRSLSAAAVLRNALLGALAAAGIAAAPAASAQTATFYGSLGNFDVVNNTGENACGFRMDLPGIVPESITLGAFSANRYGYPVISGYVEGTTSGTRVEYRSNDCSKNYTTPHAPGGNFQGSCYEWNPATYPTAGCEHFGLYASGNIPTPTSRWLVADPANPANAIPFGATIAVPQPYYYIAPAPVANAAPELVEVVEAPEPAEAPELYGNAQWIKVFVRQLPREVNINELVTDNPDVVPMNAGQVEINWDVIQAEPASNSNGNRKRSRKQGNTTLDPTTRSVVRRIEMYEYTGAYDPITHEALCADLTCTAPAAGELGDFISAQMAAANVQADSLTVNRSGTGSGSVSGADKVIACGNKCASPYSAGTAVTLSAKASSGSVFSGWTGACTGTGSCTVTVNGATTVGAKFDASVKLGVATSGSGSVTSNPAGISCGSTCSTTMPKGTVVTLTAAPAAGKAFTGWNGACSGSALTCTVTLNGDTSVKAQFTK